ncbi:hypothetical protein FNO01nite_08580 [Flavobacterium noncentrifugens]|uniref:Abortive infection protein, AbiV family n=1 Tax=Flavobacterium noncentrifugens TaxID=1128970 RepID=A0A1G8TDL4_9FLAO|nr:AbiV family abortive infection protein [Flavobacterium noncentrifugens]GEP50186.1 hypothetical protein FNO01nite_08580 [Flavobacterium noncentrifugens]SDJ39611.1 abortive infection protein, AbiV family [Flavobacterium noncentrifugens]
MKTKFDNIKILTIPSMLEGIKFCFENSTNIYESALILKEQNKISVSMSLLVLSVEELMKAFALFQIMASESDEEKEVYRGIFEGNLHSNRHDFALFFNEFFKTFDMNDPDFDHNNINVIQVVSNVENEKKHIEELVFTCQRNEK